MTPILTVSWHAPVKDSASEATMQTPIRMMRIVPPLVKKVSGRRIIHFRVFSELPIRISEGNREGYRFDHSGAGMMGLATAMLGGYTSTYFPPWICVIKTTCWFWPLASNLTGPNALVLRLVLLMASRILAASKDLAELMAWAAVSKDWYACMAWYCGCEL